MDTRLILRGPPGPCICSEKRDYWFTKVINKNPTRASEPLIKTDFKKFGESSIEQGWSFETVNPVDSSPFPWLVMVNGKGGKLLLRMNPKVVNVNYNGTILRAIVFLPLDKLVNNTSSVLLDNVVTTSFIFPKSYQVKSFFDIVDGDKLFKERIVFVPLNHSIINLTINNTVIKINPDDLRNKDMLGPYYIDGESNQLDITLYVGKVTKKKKYYMFSFDYDGKDIVNPPQYAFEVVGLVERPDANGELKYFIDSAVVDVNNRKKIKLEMIQPKKIKVSLEEDIESDFAYSMSPDMSITEIQTQEPWIIFVSQKAVKVFGLFITEEWVAL